eukprot:CAMPEP_0176155848 /NCGR_PEP_ID=MMETSP0120_2-20121206/79653_1 /TAXON_ID=160619 /ORGANISM="Kryptoperidinium foliaceum, Strain CCMP 1326" /LENGTH=57 /DNA_ID=CAMNT_0017493039 /DNA_START=5 /DNA_END=174 /DNA_ORIENTATION=+
MAAPSACTVQVAALRPARHATGGGCMPHREVTSRAFHAAIHLYIVASAPLALCIGSS